MSKDTLDVIREELEAKLAITEDEPCPPDSIMTCGVLCDHDHGFLCDHRRKWIFDYIASLSRIE